MIGLSPISNQRDAFAPLLTDFIDLEHELVKLAHQINWSNIEKALAGYYSHTGQPAMPIRFMAGSLLLKRLYNLGDETLAQAWVMNPYMQYFCGQAHFQHHYGCDPSDLVHFRKRIGKQGVEAIFKESIRIHGAKANEPTVLSDTTVQGNNITFPTDAKLAKKVIDTCSKIARKEGIKQRQSFTFVSKQALRDTYNSKHPARRKKAKKAMSKLKTMAGRSLRDLKRKLSPQAKQTHSEFLELSFRVLDQKKNDKDKIYSLYKPFTACIAKGKAHSPYEFGNKTGIITTQNSGIILAVETFMGNPHDSKTIAPLLEMLKRMEVKKPKELVYDRAGKGKKEIDGVQILTPSKPKKSDSEYRKRKLRNKFRRRASIEPIIGHLKTDHRMENNYLHGEESPQIHAILAAAGWNMKKWMREINKKIKKLFFPNEYIPLRFCLNPIFASS